MADTNRVSIAYSEEATFGTQAAGLAQNKWSYMRITGESLSMDPTYKKSDELRSDRQVADMLRTSIKNGGSVNWELSHSGRLAAAGAGVLDGFPDDHFRYALQSAGWSTPVAVGPIATIAAVNATANVSRFTDSANGFGSLAVGQWIKTTGFTAANNNGYFKITVKAVGQIDCVGPTNTTTEAAAAGRKIQMGGQIVNGVTAVSTCMERNHTDVTMISQFFGDHVDQMSMRIPSEDIITGTFTFAGKSQTNTATSLTAANGITAAQGNEVLETVDHIPYFMEGTQFDSTSVGAAIEVTFQTNNNVRPRPQLGSLGPISMGFGRFEATGTLRQYFLGASLIDKFLANTNSGLAMIIRDSTNAMAYVIEFPRVRYTMGKQNAGGGNQDVIADLNWEAFRHPTEGITMRITRFA